MKISTTFNFKIQSSLNTFDIIFIFKSLQGDLKSPQISLFNTSTLVVYFAYV